jgi:LPS O-antigen subunit length determinant protein (WzzB/FepE family)
MRTDTSSTDPSMNARIELTTKEAETLKDILDRYLRDLSYEIADTDKSSFKDEIKAHREIVRDIAAKLP